MAVFSILRFFMLLHGSFTGDNHLLLLIFKGFDVVLNILSAGCLFRILYNSKNKVFNLNLYLIFEYVLILQAILSVISVIINNHDRILYMLISVVITIAFCKWIINCINIIIISYKEDKLKLMSDNFCA